MANAYRLGRWSDVWKWNGVAMSGNKAHIDIEVGGYLVV